jgi:hypothetical protein
VNKKKGRKGRIKSPKGKVNKEYEIMIM